MKKHKLDRVFVATDADGEGNDIAAHSEFYLYGVYKGSWILQLMKSIKLNKLHFINLFYPSHFCRIEGAQKVVARNGAF